MTEEELTKEEIELIQDALIIKFVISQDTDRRIIMTLILKLQKMLEALKK